MVAGALGLLYGWHFRGTIRANGIDPGPNCTGIDQFFYGVLAVETASPLKASMIRSPCVSLSEASPYSSIYKPTCLIFQHPGRSLYSESQPVAVSNCKLGWWYEEC